MVIKINETILAARRGMFEIITPYIIQMIIPVSSIIKVVSDRSPVCLVFIALIDWGRNANVVRLAAISPVINTGSNLFNF